MLSRDGLKKALGDLLEQIPGLKDLSDHDKKTCIDNLAETLQKPDHNGPALQLTNTSIKNPLIVKALAGALVEQALQIQKSDPSFASRNPGFNLQNMNNFLLKMGLPRAPEQEEARQADLICGKSGMKDKKPSGPSSRSKDNSSEEYSLVAVYDESGNVLDVMEGHFAPASGAAAKVSLTSIYAESGISPEESLISLSNPAVETNYETQARGPGNANTFRPY